MGFELEFTGLSLGQASEPVRQALGGNIVKKHTARQVINVDGLGEFQVELDWAYLKKEAAQAPDADHLTLLRDAASLVVPVEVVCAPIPITAMNRLYPMVNKLREAGARGTDDSLIAAFGVHINASLPALDDDRIKARPTFHYRLPNCSINEADWNLSQSWNLWCLVEALACQTELLTKLGKDFIAASRPLLGINKQLWIETIDECLKNEELA